MKFNDPFVRLRAMPRPDSYDPETIIDDGWGAPDRKELLGFFDDDDSETVADAVRSQNVSRRTLYVQPAADVRTGDRVEWSGATWSIDGEHSVPKNPFTGWQPYRKLKLKKAVG